MAAFIRYKNYLGTGRDLIDWNPQETIGYEPKSTYYSDMSIAEPFGKKAILDTYKHAMKFHGKDVEMMAELAMIFSWKSLEHYEKNDALSALYSDLYYRHCDFVCNTFEPEAVQKFYEIID